MLWQATQVKGAFDFSQEEKAAPSRRGIDVAREGVAAFAKENNTPTSLVKKIDSKLVAFANSKLPPTEIEMNALKNDLRILFPTNDSIKEYLLTQVLKQLQNKYDPNVTIADLFKKDSPYELNLNRLVAMLAISSKKTEAESDVASYEVWHAKTTNELNDILALHGINARLSEMQINQSRQKAAADYIDSGLQGVYNQTQNLEQREDSDKAKDARKLSEEINENTA